MTAPCLSKPNSGRSTRTQDRATITEVTGKASAGLSQRLCLSVHTRSDAVAGVLLFANRIETDSPALGRALTLADPETVWVISRGVVLNDIGEGRLLRLDVETSPTMGAIGGMSLADEVPTPAFRAFSTALQRVARGAVPQQAHPIPEVHASRSEQPFFKPIN